MNQPFTQEHWQDENGNPSGGTSFGTGFAVSWQHGPLGRGEDRTAPNGAFVETLLSVVEGRLNFYQEAAEGRFKCKENHEAIRHIQLALEWLESRTAQRELRGVEGTHGA